MFNSKFRLSCYIHYPFIFITRGYYIPLRHYSHTQFVESLSSLIQPLTFTSRYNVHNDISSITLPLEARQIESAGTY